MRRFPCPIGRIKRALRNDSRRALVFHHRIYVGRRKLFHRTCGKGGGHEGDGSATDRRLLFLCTNLVRVAATNNGRPQYGDRSGFYGLQNRGIEASSVSKDSFSFGPPRYAERRTLAAIDDEDRATTHGHETSHQAAMAASPKACGISASRSAQPAVRRFRLGLFFNAIVGSLARMPLARPKKADDVMADASSSATSCAVPPHSVLGGFGRSLLATATIADARL